MQETVGIIVAETEERKAVMELLTNQKQEIKYGTPIYLGENNKKQIVIIQTEVGKVNAARGAQILIDFYHPDYIINIGSAGAISNELEIGDIIIAEKLVQHDFDTTAFGRKKGEISNVGREIVCDKNLLKKAKESLLQIEKKEKIKIGIIASGDIFCTKEKQKEEIGKEFKAVCLEMEAAAIAQVCYLDDIPFLAIKSISDTPNGKNQQDFTTYLKTVSQKCAEFLRIFLANRN